MKWKDRCIQEANCGHNDGWTMEWYKNELKKIEKNEKKKTQSSTCFTEKSFWEVE